MSIHWFRLLFSPTCICSTIHDKFLCPEQWFPYFQTCAYSSISYFWLNIIVFFHFPIVKFFFFGQICRFLQIIILRLCKNKQWGDHMCIWQQILLDGMGSKKTKGNHGIFLAWGKMLSQKKIIFEHAWNFYTSHTARLEQTTYLLEELYNNLLQLCS